MDNQQPSINFKINKGSTTIPKGSRLQVDGNRSGEHLNTKNSKDEDIV